MPHVTSRARTSAEGLRLTRSEGNLPDGHSLGDRRSEQLEWHASRRSGLRKLARTLRHVARPVDLLVRASVEKEEPETRGLILPVHPGARHFRRALRKAGPYHRERPVQRRSDLGGDDGNVPERIDGALTQCTVSGYIPSYYNGNSIMRSRRRCCSRPTWRLSTFRTAGMGVHALTSAWSALITCCSGDAAGQSADRSRARTGATASLDQSQPAQAGFVE